MSLYCSAIHKISNNTLSDRCNIHLQVIKDVYAKKNISSTFEKFLNRGKRIINSIRVLYNLALSSLVPVDSSLSFYFKLLYIFNPEISSMFCDVTVFDIEYQRSYNSLWFKYEHPFLNANFYTLLSIYIYKRLYI